MSEVDWTKFHVGQRVICISARTQKGRIFVNGEQFPVAGEVYTIRDLDVCNGQPVCRLVEIINERGAYWNGDILEHDVEPSFSLNRFQPVRFCGKDISRDVDRKVDA